MPMRETGYGPGNISDLAVQTRDRYIENNLVDVISGESNLAKFLTVSDVNSEYRQRMGLRPRKHPYIPGPDLQVPLMYQLGSNQWINGASLLNTNTPSNLTAARFQWKEMVGPPMGLSRRDILLNGDSETKIFDLVETQMEASITAVIEGLEQDLAGSASGFEILGLQDLIEDSPTSTIGQIPRATNAFWRNYADATAYASFGTGNAGFRALETMYQSVKRGMEQPDVYFTTSAIQRYWTDYLVTNGTWNTFDNSPQAQDLGIIHDGPWFHKAPVVASEGIAAKHVYAINTNTCFLVFKPGQKFVETGNVRAFDSLQQINWIYAMLAFIITNPKRNGVITDIQAI